MSVNVNGRKVSMFRCHIDPMIGNPKNAFRVGLDGVAMAELTPAGMYVKRVFGNPGDKQQESEHLVPYANLQSVTLLPEEKFESKAEGKAEAKR